MKEIYKKYQFYKLCLKYLGFLVYFVPITLAAISIKSQDIPTPLEPWTQWVLHDFQTQTCPINYTQTLESFGEQIHHCYYPSRFSLNIQAKQAEFTQEWLVQSPGWIALPGNAEYWPQEVQINNTTALVADRQGIPSLFAPKGQLIIQGQFHWEQRPEFLQIPTATGLITLTLDGTRVEIPELDVQGRLWLRQRGVTVDSDAAEDRLTLRVYRQIIDDIPLQVITRIELDVAGRHREEILGPVLLDRHQAMALDSPLPARLETGDLLRLQVRPGSWVLTLRTRQEGLTHHQLTLPNTAQTQWVNEEIWVFQARNDLRLVEVSGVAAIDPQQTALPNAWRKFPTYQMHVGDVLELTEKRRGDPDPVPDQLQLERQFWLDFDGQGYSVQDRISGTMTRGWRLEIAEPALLGRVSINGQDQFITRLTEESHAGVEVRRGQIELVADSRLEQSLSSLPAVGWAHDFQAVSGTLHLPPGWLLLNASGVDDIPDTWLKQWTLLDLFIVLIMTAAIGKLWHWGWGGLTLITMILIYHESAAPHWVWLNIIAAMALLRVLPELGWFSRLVRLYRNLSLISLLIIVLPFMIQQARQSIYPQLKYPWAQLETHYDYSETEATSEVHDLLDEEEMMSQVDSVRPAMAPPERVLKGNVFQEQRRYKKKSAEKLVQIDPNAQVQTGPGLPQWEWLGIHMRWSGPVEQNQSIQLWLLSPQQNSVLGALRIILLVILTAFLLWQAWGGTRTKSLFKKSVAVPKTSLGLLIIGILFSFLSFSPSSFSSEVATEKSPSISENRQPQTLTTTDFPPQALLDELQKRLLAPPKCWPYCASSPRLRLELKPNQLQIRMEIHTLAEVVVPLPGLAQQWLPQQIWVDGHLAQGLLRDKQGQLGLNLKEGVHQIQLLGILPNRHTVQLALPLKPRLVEVTQVEGWRIEGLHENGVADKQLQFTRLQQDETELTHLEMGSLPPFIRIERTLSFGLDWQIETRITRLTPLGSAIVLEIPLLAGESVTSDKMRIEEGKALINLSPHESEMSWVSVFDKQNSLTLTAPANSFSHEVWRLDASAIWHVEIEGIPVVHHQNAEGRWLPEWRPWPGESVTLYLTRPTGVTGQVLTIDRTRLIVNPGQRTTDNRLLFNLRSSRGAQHQLVLPEDAELQSVEINGQLQPIRQEGRLVTLPINPGSQQVALLFRQPIGISKRFETSQIELGQESVNTHIEINMPRERWILFVGGGPIGPAVMIWGILIVIILAAIGLGQISFTPLKTHHWLLLGIVLSQVSVPLMLVVVAWFMVLAWRAHLPADTPPLKFNLFQIGLGILTIAALVTLLLAIEQGLLGHPDMHIAGNGSDSEILRWYQDRTSGVLPQVWVFSWPMWIYRVAMLLWALWLSFALLRWLNWGWQCFSLHGLWKPFPCKKSVQT